jgi:hypothetical protein
MRAGDVPNVAGVTWEAERSEVPVYYQAEQEELACAVVDLISNVTVRAKVNL